ncbi:hypothetical protein BN14_07978 [Rhizoctonia solani AG-1 IB]|uniref:HAT C-terminal dimerisation domain-containing protein n=1 Tax=Thanatephorus cucumeris (strain AG1-IB / isolate 7/3/14) TaxID=1108050 RepID=M5C394_THACB|nr:hypothetical protein BN14_07978 [Rhizoctonia solani AG-1 IB]
MHAPTARQPQRFPPKTQLPALYNKDNDPDFEPQPTSESCVSNSDNASDTSKPKEPKKNALEPGSQASTQKRGKISEANTYRTGEDESKEDKMKQEKSHGKKHGPQGIAWHWAFANYKAPNPTHHPDTAKPIWLFKCKHCNSIQRFQRTDNCLEFSRESRNVSATNLVAHLNKCKQLPAEHKLKAVKSWLNQPSETLTPAQASVALLFKLSSPGSVPLPLAVSNTVFRSALIQGVIRDNYPLTFGEGCGMQQVFALTSPHIKLPLHQTMHTDLDKLYEVLKVQVLYLLKSQDSRFVITSDAWTSKTFAYSLGGVVVTFINKGWNTQEFVLNVVHLDADHTGVVKLFEEGEIIENSTKVLEEEKWLREDEDTPHSLQLTDKLKDDLSDMDVNEPAEVSANSELILDTQSCGQRALLNCVQKVHEIAMHVTSSAKRRKQMRKIIQALKLELRAVIKSIKVCWNSVLAEIRHALLLKQAFNQDKEWDMLGELVQILEPFEFATRAFSVQAKTTLHSVLPTYALLHMKLDKSQAHLGALYGPQDALGIVDALSAGKAKLDEYYGMAKENNLTVLASALHPGMRLLYFQDMDKCSNTGPVLAERAKKLLEYLYEDYKYTQLDLMTGSAVQPTTTKPIVSGSPAESWFDSLLKISPGEASLASLDSKELHDYFDGRYQYTSGDILVWWKEHKIHFPVLSQIAWDFLAIPATSVSVEHTAQRIITCQQWLEAGLGTHLPDFISGIDNQ